MNQFLIDSLVIALVIQLIFFMFAAIRKTDVFTDLSYGLTFVLIAIWALLKTNLELPSILLTAVITIWGVRLAGFLFMRIRKLKIDARFNGISGGLSGICRIRVNPDGSLPEKDYPAQIPIHESIHTGLKLIIGPLKNNNIISRWENESCVRAIQSTIPGFPEHADNYSELKLRHPTPIDQFLADPIRVVVDFPRCISEFVSWKNQR